MMHALSLPGYISQPQAFRFSTRVKGLGLGVIGFGAQGLGLGVIGFGVLRFRENGV